MFTLAGSTAQATAWHAGSLRTLPAMRGELTSFVNGLAHPSAGGYGKVSSTRTANFRAFLDALSTALDAGARDGDSGDWCGVQARATAAGYALRRFYDTGTGRWFLYAYDTTSNGQAYLFINPYAKRNLVIEVPHEPHDAGTGVQGARLFTALAARALVVNKEDRCSDPDATTCSGSTSTCGGYFRESDVAHHEQNTFHLLHRWFSDGDSRTRIVQLHGMSGSRSDMAEIGDGTRNDYDPGSISTRFAHFLRAYVPSPSAIHSCQEKVGDPPSNLCASTNVQGRYTNDRAVDACGSSTSYASGRFLHIEQHASLRDNDGQDGYHWGDIRDALMDLWPECGLNNGASDCSIGPVLTEYSAWSCAG